MFYLGADGHYRVPELDQFGWLVYGFGTRRCTPPESISTLRQIHSDIVLRGGVQTGCVGEGDALLSDTGVVAVKTADCLPILLVDPAQRAVAAVHAGWRGTARQIAPKAVAAMGREFGTRPADLHAAIGPGIGACCYQVGAEVAAELGQPGRSHVDLSEISAGQLAVAGLHADRIYAADLCTMCRAEEFWSYRREKMGAGRMFSFVGIGDPCTRGARM